MSVDLVRAAALSEKLYSYRDTLKRLAGAAGDPWPTPSVRMCMEILRRKHAEESGENLVLIAAGCMREAQEAGAPHAVLLFAAAVVELAEEEARR